MLGLFLIVPDFVIELRSASDNLQPTQTENAGVSTGGSETGLVNRPQETSEWRSTDKDKEAEILESPISLVENLPLAIDCNEVMPGFILEMSRMW